MTQQEKDRYEDVETLRQILQQLAGRKFRLDCHHHISFGCFLGNDITILNGKRMKIICSQCGY